MTHTQRFAPLDWPVLAAQPHDHWQPRAEYAGHRWDGTERKGITLTCRSNGRARRDQSKEIEVIGD